MTTATCQGCGRSVDHDAATLARRPALKVAAATGVEVVPDTVVLTLEVITSQAQLKKTTGYRGSRDAIPGGGMRDPTEWLIGFEVRFRTAHGWYTREFEHRQFTAFPYGN